MSTRITNFTFFFYIFHTVFPVVTKLVQAAEQALSSLLFMGILI